MAATFMTQNFAPNAQHTAFMSEANARFLQHAVQQRLSDALHTRVVVPLDDYFRTHMMQVVNASLAPAPGALGLAAMNRTFINRMATIQLFSISQGALTRKYHIDQDRPWTQPYGEFTGNDGVLVSPSNYMTSHPWSKRRAGFLAAALHLQPTGAQSGAAAASPAAPIVVDAAYCRTGARVVV